MAVSRASRWVPSGRTALGASALADGVVRAPEDVVAPLASIAGGLLASPAVGFLTTWTMFAVALYTFAHLAYGHLDVEDQTDVPREKPGFRVVFASTGVALGLAIQHLAEIWQLLAVVVPGMFAAGGVFLAYLSTLHGWDLTDPRGRGVATLERFAHGEDVATEIATDLEYPGWLGRLGLTLYLLSVALLFGIPVALAAVALQVLVYSFPIPDVLFFGWAVSARLLPQVSVGPTRERIVDLEFDFEEYLVDTTEHATRSFQGFFATTFVLLGLFLSAGYLFVGVSTAPAVAGTIAAAVGLLPAGLPPDVLLTVWNLSGALTLLFVAGSHGIWTWIRELGRLPAFLDSWEGRDTESEAEPVTRVYGFLGVAIVG